MPPVQRIVFILWLLSGVCIGLVWLFRYGFLIATSAGRSVLNARSYISESSRPETAWPPVSVIVAAKDEQDNIETCVRSLLAQDYPNVEIIVADDRSTDRTPQILRSLQEETQSDSETGASPPRLKVVKIRNLREGWFGKNNAMREGVAVSSGQWLLFTDADCRMITPRAVRVAVREAIAHDADFLSIIPVLETPTVWERIIQPACALLLILWFLPHRVNDPGRKTAYANGAFMLMRRKCYDAIGGHERVRSEVNEDVHMARLAKRMGFHLRVAENDDLYRTRMYATPAQAWRGWTRILYGSLGTTRRLLISFAMVAAYTILPWLSLAAAAIGWTVADPANRTAWTGAAGLWLAVIAAKQLALWRVYKILKVPRIWSLTHAAGAAVTIAMLASALLKVLGATGTNWRGTVYRAKRVEHDKDAADPGPIAAPAPSSDTT